jgi:predicted dehydrogenase
MKDDSIRIIHLCTPPQVRLEVIECAAAEGKHVFVEKPLALSSSEALSIRRIANEHRIMITVVHNYRGIPAVAKVKQRVAGGYLGSIVSMQGTGLIPHPANVSKAQHYYHPAGALFDFAPHVVDMLLWLNGSTPERVFAYGGDFTGRMGFVNYAQILINFENKAVAVADASWMTGIEGMRFTINLHGTAGHILLDVRSDSFTEFHGVLTPIDDTFKSLSRAMRMSKGAITGSYFAAPFLHYRTLILDFMDAIEKNRKPAVTVEQALLTTAVLEAAKMSIDENRSVELRSLLPAGEFASISNAFHDIN